jgi:hypothetical protein
MRSATRHQLRGPVAGLVALACFATLAGASTAAQRAAGPTRTVKLSLSATGKGRWSTSGDSEQGSLAINYSWKGTFAFKVPVAQLNDPKHAHLSVRTTGTLTGTWVGDYTGTRYSAPESGKYHCSYSGKNVSTRVAVVLRAGATSRWVRVLLLSGAGKRLNSAGFFPNKGSGAKVTCANTVGNLGPPHFGPSWLFRDSIQDHGSFTSAQATIVFPATLLPRGTVKAAFPHEVGSVRSSVRAELNWKNTGRVTAVAR